MRRRSIVGVTSITLISSPTGFKRFRCEVNRKKSKFERYGLLMEADHSLPLPKICCVCNPRSRESLMG